MFSQPEAVVAPTFGGLRQIAAVAERLGGAAALGNGGEIEQGIGNHVGAFRYNPMWGAKRQDQCAQRRASIASRIS